MTAPSGGTAAVLLEFRPVKRNRNRPIRRVLAALWMGGRFGTDVLAGVFRRAAERGGWDVRVVRFREILAGEIERARLDGGLDGLVFDYWGSEFPRVLQAVRVPGSAQSIGPYAFYRCAILTRLEFTGTRAQWEALSVAQGNDFSSSAFRLICADDEP